MAIIGLHALMYSKKDEETRRPWGRATALTLPSGDLLGLYEPKHPTAIARTG